MKHATVKIGNYTVPLIGIPKSATDETCELCGDVMHMSESTFQDGKMLCKTCVDKNIKNNIASPEPDVTMSGETKVCPDCNGSGLDFGNIKDCAACAGLGLVEITKGKL